MNNLNPLDHQVCLTVPLRLAPSGWIEHVPFAMYLVDVLRPRIFVELGSWYGVSYCAFCQAVAAVGSETRCFAVDTWRGDPHAGANGDEVLVELRAHHDPLYSGFSRLRQMSFDEAVAQFEDGSVDLLHIDGYHTYEAVRHDFETWLPRMSGRGVILFHDIAVHKDDFGVWRFWDEVKGCYPSYEVEFGHGLGLLAVGPEQPPALKLLLNSATEEVEGIREYFRRLGALAAALNDGDLFKREIVARDIRAEAEQAAIRAEEAAIEAERSARLRRAHPILIFASNFLQEWAGDGLGKALSLGAAKLTGSGSNLEAKAKTRTVATLPETRSDSPTANEVQQVDPSFEAPREGTFLTLPETRSDSPAVDELRQLHSPFEAEREEAFFSVFFRACDKIASVSRFPRPFDLEKRELLKICFQSLYDAIRTFNAHIYVVGDDLSDETQEFFRQFPVTLINDVLGNDASIRKCVRLALERPEHEWIYFCEDDYLHTSDAFTRISELMENRDETLGEFGQNDLIIFPPDYPDRYLKKYRQTANVFCSRTGHWRQVDCVTFTFLLQGKTLRKHASILDRASVGANDHILSDELTRRPEVLVVSPLPGISTHMHEGVMTPLVDWSRIIEKYKGWSQVPGR